MKKNPPKKHLTLGKRRCKMVARDVHKTCNKNEAIAYYVTLHVSFGLMNLCGKTFKPIKVKETHFSIRQMYLLFIIVRYNMVFLLNAFSVHGHASIELKYIKSYLFNSIQMIKVET